jgi:ketosteroid isomerase-like protein
MAGEPTRSDLVDRTRWWVESGHELDAALGLFAPDAVWDAIPLGMSYRGVEQIRRFLTDWVAAYEEYDVRADDVRDLGNGVVLAVSHQTGRLATNPGNRVREVWAFVCVWADGAVTRVIAYPNVEEARAAAERLAEELG